MTCILIYGYLFSHKFCGVTLNFTVYYIAGLSLEVISVLVTTRYARIYRKSTFYTGLRNLISETRVHFGRICYVPTFVDYFYLY